MDFPVFLSETTVAARRTETLFPEEPDQLRRSLSNTGPSYAPSDELQVAPICSWPDDQSTIHDLTGGSDHFSDGNARSQLPDHFPGETQYVPKQSLSPRTGLSGLYTPRQTCISTREELHLFRYFVSTVARNLDITDPSCHFANEAPLQAQSNQVLAYALLAASARHLSQSTEYSPVIADRYHQECLELLIPFLDDATAVSSEILLSTIVILRYLEEIDASLAFNPSHRVGTRAFINLQTHNSATDDLRSAAFWLGVRQEVYYAIANQKATMLQFDRDESDAELEPTHEGAWANRMVMHCVGVVNYCFSPQRQDNTSEYDVLLQYCEVWASSLPSSYQPVLYQDQGQDTSFPEIAFLSSAVVIGLQHYHLASMLLCAHDPKTPRVGLARISASNAVDDELRKHARMVCGLAVSNDNIPPSFVNASMAILLAEKFQEAGKTHFVFDGGLKISLPSLSKHD
ncbi:hypothetical protein D6D01_03745 [Aureobasidium pullulans]|uniref:Transcription factor domain-containing protein n=1 Tax=Aureobasidium pullulans TaxID=5580 RepID=A0A4S9LHL7_AURPU|nr:hypothetical protein D6D01_03745 [Aureobasidium pullulans]